MIKNVACGISGGVDSAIAAFLLKKKFNVIGVFMKNWDDKDEYSKCTVDIDRSDAKYACEKLKIPFVEVNFVKEYWNNVFEDTLSNYENGLTPNPDIMCNKHIKFNSFAQFCLNKLGVDAFATGHYARSSFGNYLEKSDSSLLPLLMRPADKIKDQTYWLCQVNLKYLAKCMFPLADIRKVEVKKMAEEIGLTKTLLRKESMGMCFIGKRNFRKFVDSYIEPKNGIFTLFETGKVVGQHEGVHHFTLGQKSGIPLNQNIGYVAHMNPQTQEIKLVTDCFHPSLFMKSVTTDTPHWLINYKHTDSINFRSRMQYQNRYCSIPCSINLIENETKLQIRLDKWLRCIAPGQYAVLYSPDDEICIGSSKILFSISAWEEGHREPIEWNIQHFDNSYLKKPHQTDFSSEKLINI